MERRELGAQVQAGIDKLSPDLRTCVILRDIEELSYQEIVDLLKIPEGTVKSRINRGRIELAKILRRMRVVAMSERLDKSQEARASPIEAGRNLLRSP